MDDSTSLNASLLELRIQIAHQNEETAKSLDVMWLLLTGFNILISMYLHREFFHAQLQEKLTNSTTF
jgi:hypothetical protein